MQKIWDRGGIGLSDLGELAIGAHSGEGSNPQRRVIRVELRLNTFFGCSTDRGREES